MKKIEPILKIIPLFSFLLILVSSIKLAAFYKVFNIDIVNYLSISEYIPLFLDDIHTLLYFSFVFMIGFFFGKKSKNEKMKKNENKKLKTFSIIFIICIILICAIVLYYNSESMYKILGHFIDFFVIIMFAFAVLYLSRKKEILLKNLLGWIFLLITVPIIADGYRDAHQIIENKRNVKYEVLIKGKKLENNNLFLGKSSKYIFFYNIDKRTSIIYPMSNVDKINIIALNKSKN